MKRQNTHTHTHTHIKCIRLQRTYNKKAFPSSHTGSISRLTFVLLLLQLDFFLAERIKHVAFMPLVSQTYFLNLLLYVVCLHKIYYLPLFNTSQIVFKHGH